MKTIPVKRSVEYFNKSNLELGEFGELAGQYDISTIPLRTLKKIVADGDGDPYLYDVYDLNEEQLVTINALISEPIDYFFDKFDYCLACSAVPGYYEEHRTKGGRKGGYPAPI
ncbi:MAG: DUF7683 domain-containing protein [Mucilaginibacter sp.]